MRAELARILTQRYGETALPRITLIEPTEEQTALYAKHVGYTRFNIDLSRDPNLIVIDTGLLRPIRHSWISRRQRDHFYFNVSAGELPVSTAVKYDSYDQVTEGLEIEIHYGHSHNREVPYTTRVVPLW